MLILMKRISFLWETNELFEESLSSSSFSTRTIVDNWSSAGIWPNSRPFTHSFNDNFHILSCTIFHNNAIETLKWQFVRLLETTTSFERFKVMSWTFGVSKAINRHTQWRIFLDRRDFYRHNILVTNKLKTSILWQHKISANANQHKIKENQEKIRALVFKSIFSTISLQLD